MRRAWLWSKEKTVNAIQELHRNSEPINSWYVNVQHSRLYRAACRYWLGWRQAVQAAGFDYEEVRIRQKGRSPKGARPYRRRTTKGIIYAALDRKSRGLKLNSTAVFNDDQALYRAACRRFGRGGWQRVLRRIGVDPRTVNPPRKWTAERVLNEIHQLREGGYRLSARYLSRSGYGKLRSAGVRIFGSWKKAVKAAGLAYENIQAVRFRWWSKRRIISEIKRLRREGTPLNSKAVQRSHHDLFTAACVYFDGWGQAVEAAGMDYREHLLVWSRKTWLRALTPAKLKAMERQVERLAAMRRNHGAKVELRSHSGVAGERHRHR